MLELLRSIDIADLDWHAERYDSATELRSLVEIAYHTDDLLDTEILGAVQRIAELCIEDGADFGSIPCLGGKPLTVWNELLGELESAAGEYTEFFGEGYSIR